MFVLLAARLVYVQGILRTELQKRADRQFSRKPKSVASRARILDIHNNVLSETVQIYSCFVDPSMMKNRAAVAKRLAGAFGMNEKNLTDRIKKSTGSFIWIKHNVPPAIMAQLKEEEIPGVAFRPEVRRNYPEGPLASHLLGLVGTEGHGLSGIEQIYEKVLDSETASKAKNTDVLTGDVQLTIDASIQKAVERELSWGVDKTGAKKGYVIVQDPWNGDILAAASWPPVSLDPDNPPHPDDLRIPVMVDVFEPGSTFKIVIAAAALGEKLISNRDVFDGEKGKWKVMGITIHDHEPRPKMSFDDIMVYSSNIGTSKIADRVGSERLYQYARMFGFGAFTGSGLSGEAKGMLRTPNRWSGVSKYAVSFGQEVSVTALQLAGAYSAIANGGLLMEPRFVHAVLSAKGEILKQVQPTQVRRAISPEVAARLTDMLSKVVEKGTGINAQIQWDRSIRVAGKTGTAQKFDVARKRYDEHLTVVSFCGFFPADKPQYTVVVILDEPEGRSWGGLDAAPVFRRIAEHLSPRIERPQPMASGNRSKSKRWI